MRISKLAVIGAVLATAAPALAQEAPAAGVCAPALALTAARPTPVKEPALPSCVNEKAKTHTCRKGEIPKYNAALDAEVKRYNAELDVYVKALQAYLESATAYVNCEVAAVNAANRKP